MADEVKVGGEFQQPTGGSAGVQSQVPGAPATVSAAAGATGGIAAGNFIEVDIDDELFRFKGDDTPLMQIMLKARKVKVNSPIVDHYMLDEPRSHVTGTQAVNAGSDNQFVLPLEPSDRKVLKPHDTVLVQGVDGYTEDGQKLTPGKELMLIMIGTDTTTGNPIMMAINGPKNSATDEYCTVPEIPAGSTFVILSNALYETQKEVAPDLILPQPSQIYCQKRGMNQVVSDYFESQKKRIPFSKAVIAEQAITNFKLKGNRTLYAGRKGQITVDAGKVGIQKIFFTEGVRYQVKKELQHVGKWTYEQLIALAKMAFTGEDVPKSVIVLCGKNFLENIQCIDYKNHPEIQITQGKNEALGWTVTKVHTVFGDFEFKHDSTLDRLRWSNSAFLVSLERVVHYVYSQEHKSKDRIEGEEATREALLVWDALGLKGTCHIWINGESTADNGNSNDSAVHIHYWDDDTAPVNPQDGCVYYLMKDCPEINDQAKSGTMWQYKNSAWSPYDGELNWN